jgi:phosphoribosyl-AMP cyclohydrolase
MSDAATATLPITFSPDDGLIPVVIQDATSGDVLMVGFMNEEALVATRTTGLVHFWSRSRQQLWQKGGTSGHVQRVRGIYVNCDQNSLLIEVDQAGAVCHDGYPTCYYRRLEPDNSLQTIRERWFDPTDVYGASEGIAGLTQRWWGAYAYLRDNDLASVSRTSRTLRNPSTSVLSRVADELRELAGVVDGSHVHRTQRDDTLLEAGQVCYWTAVEAVRAGLTWEEVRPDRALDRTPDDATIPATTLVSLLNARADALGESPLTAAEAHDVFALAGTVCAAMGLLPSDLILRDLEELRTRPYLEPYLDR